ncbi:acyltransferase family protein [Patulibacter minatonensis]|uniref:acyltransferase family protein n=1 Tax=Patulibacter minatonensis TaxID=298163 RepID=UPI00047E15BC|nr:acyltransferase [Patulibacter minatonensis]
MAAGPLRARLGARAPGSLLSALRPAPGRRPELDGLRGIAVLLVVIAHAWNGVSPHNRPFYSGAPTFLPGGGEMGVQLFFVLSGFLITGILVRSWSSRGVRSLPTFYARRFLRLLPALLSVCFVYGVAIVLTKDQGLERHLAANSVWAALTYTTNFPLFPNDNFLGHTWTLAVEEQFYLVWPAVLFLALRLGGAKHGLKVAGAVALASVVATVLARHAPGVTDETIVTRLRWDALGVGALLALFPIRVNRWIGLAGLAVVLYVSLREGAIDPDVYLLTAVASAAVIGASARLPWLAWRPLQFLGLISYGLYLWHMFVLRLGWPGPVSVLVAVVISIASYVLLELPIMRRGAAYLARRAGAREQSETEAAAQTAAAVAAGGRRSS